MSARLQLSKPLPVDHVPMLDLKAEYQALKEEINQAVLEVMASGCFVMGPNVAALEEEMASYLDVPYAVSCGSGTDALRLALMAAGIGAGDEVITTGFTFIATASAIAGAGATPVFVDVDPQTWTLDPARVAAAIGPRTRAVLPVHLYGQSADMVRLNSLCRDYGLLLIEDCAQAFGATVRGESGNQSVGTIGEFGCFSFYPAKNLGAYGDGGLVVTHSSIHAARLRALRNHGSHTRYQHDFPGINSRLDEMQAAILRVKLRHLDDANSARRRIAGHYSENLSGAAVTLPAADIHGCHVYNQYTILSSERDVLMQALQARGISCVIHYPIPLHRQPALQGICDTEPLPVTEQLVTQCLSLPVYPQMPKHFVDAVVAAIRSAVNY